MNSVHSIGVIKPHTENRPGSRQNESPFEFFLVRRTDTRVCNCTRKDNDFELTCILRNFLLVILQKKDQFIMK